jgi:hypothetical protein
MTTRTTEITNNSDRKFTVRIVDYGDKYGRDMCLTHESGDYDFGPMIEFYDATYDFDKDVDGTPLGQFVSRYYVETLIDRHDETVGLNLCGHEPAWRLDADSYNKVLEFATRAYTEIVTG